VFGFSFALFMCLFWTIAFLVIVYGFVLRASWVCCAFCCVCAGDVELLEISRSISMLTKKSVTAVKFPACHWCLSEFGKFCV
jgi:hypothetical protein